ncbi:MAG: hypothetical protein PHP57_05705 [Sideroxydans sp.]|nr:hypothetical protein [Sideroxydans sp.]
MNASKLMTILICTAALVACGGSGKDSGVGGLPPSVLTKSANSIYVANSGSNSISVIDAETNALFKTIPVGKFPTALAVNNTTNRAYVANTGDNTLSVIDTLSDTVLTTLPTGANPVGVAVNPITERVYVSNSLDNSVSVINSLTNQTITTLAVGSAPFGISIDSHTNKLYVANNNGGTVSVIDASTNTVSGTLPTTVTASNFLWKPYDVEVDPVSGKLFVTEGGSSHISVFDTSTGSLQIRTMVSANLRGMGINPNDNSVYVAQANASTGLLYKIGTQGNWAGVSGGRPGAIDVAVNPKNNYAYIANITDNTINVVKLKGQANFGDVSTFIATIAVGKEPRALAVVNNNQALPQYPAIPGLGINWTVHPQQAVNTTDIHRSIATDQTQYVAVGDGGIIKTSLDGITWTYRNSGTANNLSHISYLNGQFIVLGAAGTILTSPDAVTWAARTSATTAQLNSVTFGASTYVAVGAGGVVLTSADLLTWTPQTSTTINNLNGITFGNSMFIAVGDKATVLTSADAVTWTFNNSASLAATGNISTSNVISANLTTIYFANGKFVAAGTSPNVGYSGGNTMDCVVSSLDGAVWGLAKGGASATIGSISANSSLLNFANGQLFWHSQLNPTVYWTSSDAVTWTQRLVPVIGNSSQAMPTVMTYANGQFVGVGLAGKVAVSSDGIAWRYTGVRSFGGNSIAYGNGLFVGVNYEGMALSSDGISGIYSSPLGSFYSTNPLISSSTPSNIRYLNGLFFAVHSSGRLVTSPDGITWTERIIPGYTMNGTLFAATYAKGLYVVTGYDFIATSPDTITWTVHKLSAPNWLLDIQFLNNEFVAVGERGLIVRSKDGITWTEQSFHATDSFDYTTGAGNKPRSQAFSYGVAYGNGVYVIAGNRQIIGSYGFQPSLATSTDLINWTERADTVEGWANGLLMPGMVTYHRVIFVDGMFVLFSSDLAGSGRGVVLTSRDGINWADRTPASTTSAIRDIIYANGKLVLVGPSLLMTSP